MYFIRYSSLCTVITMLLVYSGNTVAAGNGNNWIVKDVAQGSSSPCVLESAEVAVNDGYLDIGVRLSFSGDGLRGVTPSNIDLDGNDLGLQVDNKARVAIASVEDGTNVLLNGTPDDIGAQFVRGGKASLKLRFWPSWPVTGTKTATFSLSGFTKAWKKYLQCR